MIRYTFLWLFVFGIIGFARRDWCKSLSALILLLAVLERPDMPKEMFGITGFNPFNVALFGIVLVWIAARTRNGAAWEAPRWMTFLLVLYLLVTTISTARLLLDPSYLVIFQREDLEVSTMRGLIADYGLNTFKWIIPALLVLQGCRGEERYRWLAVGVLGMYAILAVLVIKQMPLGYLLDGEALQQRAANILQRRVGYHRVDLATMFAGGAWVMLAARPMFQSKAVRACLMGLSGLTMLGLALTGGRTGYATWCLVGLVMAVLRWRRYLLLAPVALGIVLIFAPGISQRMLQGFQGGGANDQLITSGRSLVWPYVSNKIGEAPIAGFGRQAWVRTNLRFKVAVATGENFGHPHNAYLEFALDNGVIGVAVLLPLFGLVLWKAVRMFRDRGNPMVEAAGGMALAATLSYMIAAFGAQTFYPRESSVGMWCLIALAIRVAQDKKAALVATAPARTRVPVRRGWRQPASGAAERFRRPERIELRPGSRVRQWLR